MGLVVVGAQVGAAGGELVYEHGAAAAYVQPTSGGNAVAAQAIANEGEDRDEDAN
jgi:hypothetical protein